MARGERVGVMTPDEPEELRPTQLVERTRAALYHALVTADPLADVYHHPITASFVGHYFTALGPAIGRYREPADQDRFAREEAARFLALLVPSAVAEAQAHYRANHGRGVLLCDNTDGRGNVRFWYVRPRETPAVLADVPAETRADVAALLQVYDPKAEAIIVLRLPHAIQAVYATADGTMRSDGLHRLGPRLVR